MSTDPMNFRLDPSDYLGHEHEQFKQTLMELALSEPKKYFELRKDVLRCENTSRQRCICNILSYAYNRNE
jgi:hypothetical protein